MKHLKIASVAAILALTTAIPAHSQLRYGISLGGSFPNSSISGTEGYETVNRSGFRGGLMLEYQSDKSGLAADFAVMYHRFNTKLRNESSGVETSLGRNFIDLPLNIKYKFWLSSLNNLFAPTLETGPALMVNVDSKHDTPFKLRRVYPLWNIGVGFDAANILQVKCGYRFGLGNALKRNDMSPDAKLSMSGFYVSANLLFDF